MQHYIVIHETKYGNANYIVKASDETVAKEDFEEKLSEALGLGEIMGEYLNWDVLDLEDVIIIE